MTNLPENVHPLDVDVFRAINGLAGNKYSDVIAIVLSSQWLWIIVALCLIGWSMWRGSKSLRAGCLVMAIAVGASDLTAYRVLKPWFARERPCHVLEDVNLPTSRCGGDYGLPSNHASNGAAWATAGWMYLGPHMGIPMFAFAILVALTRVFLGVHYPTDIGLGLVVGTVVGLVVGLFMIRLFAVARLRRERI